MYTHGTIDKIHFNGRISYKGNETRADGVPLEVAETEVLDESNEEEDDDDDEVVFGKGFDYSDSESDVEFEDKDDFEEIMGTDDPENENKRPDSFSKISVKMLENNAALAKEFPLFTTCCEWIIELKGGQTLYLPAGWFHEVASTGREDHTALNYWYHPPDAIDNFKGPYQDRFWSEEQTNRAGNESP